MAPVVEFVGQSAQDQDNVAANPSRLLNFYREPVISEGRTRYALKAVLGQEAKDDIGTAPVRAMGRGNGKNWAVGDGKLWEIASDGTLTNRATVADDANTTIAGNLSDVTVVSGNKYQLWDGSTLTEPTTKTFTNVGSHCHVGGYTVITETNGQRFQWSSVGDAGTLDALDFATANRVDDNILRAVEYRGNLLLMCETSTEIWAINPDAADTAERFTYVDMTNTGLKAFNLLVRFDDAMFFVGQDSRVYIFGQGVVSTPPVESALKLNAPTHCFYYEDEGHKFCAIRFSDCPAWVFDITTGEWHERSESAGHTQWRATASVRNGAGWLVGNADGEILELARTSRDLQAPLYRRAIGRTLFLGDRKFTVPRAELLARVGDHDLDTAEDFVWSFGDGTAWEIDTGEAWLIDSVPAGDRNAVVKLYESADGGRTWRGPFERSMGQLADYSQRMIWRARGQFQQYTPRIELEDEADITIYADMVLEAR